MVLVGEPLNTVPFISPLKTVFFDIGCLKMNLLTEAVIPANILSKHVFGNGKTASKVSFKLFKKKTSTASISYEC